MSHETIQFFTGTEEVLVNLLIDTGMQKNIAPVLVFLAGIPEATSHAIERETDLRQPDVSLAMKSLKERGWINPARSPLRIRAGPRTSMGRQCPLPGSWTASGKKRTMK